TAQDAQTIRDAFARAKPNSEYARLYAAAVARRQADQIYNLSLTRTATVILGRGARGVIGVGRVKTPTLAIVCKRELEIRNFVPVTYFEVIAIAKVVGGEFKMRHAPQEKILKREIAENIATAAEGFEGPLAVRVEDKRQGPPKLHDLPSLQKLCSSRFGWSATKTLEVAQELYDGQGKKIITYRHGADAVQVMTENPYRLARDIRGSGFKTADGIAMRLGIEKTAMIRVRAGISYALAEAMSDGHCGLPNDELLPLAVELLEVPKELIQTAL